MSRVSRSGSARSASSTTAIRCSIRPAAIAIGASRMRAAAGRRPTMCWCDADARGVGHDRRCRCERLSFHLDYLGRCRADRTSTPHRCRRAVGEASSCCLTQVARAAGRARIDPAVLQRGTAADATASCPRGLKYINNPWQDHVVDRLRQIDPRWGYNAKPNRSASDNGGVPVVAAGDELAYYYGSGTAQGSNEVYLVDILERTAAPRRG